MPGGPWTAEAAVRRRTRSDHTVTTTPTTTPTPATDEPRVDDLLLDRYLPTFDTTLHAHRVVDADLATTWRALVDLDLMEVHTPLMDAAMLVRGVPERLRARSADHPPPAPPATLRLTADDGPGLPGWLSLGQRDGAEVAFGAVGRFWQPEITWYDVTELTPDGFAAFTVPGWGRIAAGFSLRPYGTRTLASYEARTATPDPGSARRFARYWSLVRPVVGHIMRASLATLARDAEHEAASR
jgi:hypothetical protein